MVLDHANIVITILGDLVTEMIVCAHLYTLPTF
jgi:hypothetical protein